MLGKKRTLFFVLFFWFVCFLIRANVNTIEIPRQDRGYRRQNHATLAYGKI